MSFHYILFRTFVHATESEAKVRQALEFVAGDVEILTEKSKGHFGNPIIILEAKISRNKEIKGFIMKLREVGILTVLTEELEQRMDEDCALHLRLSKQKAYLGEIVLAADPDVINCRMKIAAYPANPDVASKTCRKFILDLKS